MLILLIPGSFSNPPHTEQVFATFNALQQFVENFLQDRHTCFLALKHGPDQSFKKIRHPQFGAVEPAGGQHGDFKQDRAKADAATTRTTVAAFECRRRARKPLPYHLPSERVTVATPASCSCCGSSRIMKMGADTTETLEVVPRQWKVTQTVRKRSTCRDREKISQPPAPFHPTRPVGGMAPSC